MSIIQSIKFKIGEKEIELTELEARELKRSLDGIFQEPMQFPSIAPIVITSPWYQVWKYGDQPYGIYPQIEWSLSTSTNNSSNKTS